MKKYIQMMSTMLFSGMLDIPFSGNHSYRASNSVIRKSHPWDEVFLSKKERLGKSYEELQDLRKTRWEEAQRRNE
jgi:hypothetical protein